MMIDIGTNLGILHVDHAECEDVTTVDEMTERICRYMDAGPLVVFTDKTQGNVIVARKDVTYINVWDPAERVPAVVDDESEDEESAAVDEPPADEEPADVDERPAPDGYLRSLTVEGLTDAQIDEIFPDLHAAPPAVGGELVDA